MGDENQRGIRDVDVEMNMDGGGATALNAAPDVAAATAADTTVAPGATPGDASAALIQSLRERRLITLALADQVGEDRWRTTALPHDRSLHDLLTTLLAWDEWAAAVFEVSLLRGLPAKLIAPVGSAEARHDFEARAITRYRPLSRADMLSSVQAAGERDISAAIGRGAEGWSNRPIAGLALVQVGDAEALAGADKAADAPTVGDILRWLIRREQRRDELISAGLGVTADIEQLRKRFVRA